MSREPLVAALGAWGFGVSRALTCGSCFGLVAEMASNHLKVSRSRQRRVNIESYKG